MARAPTAPSATSGDAPSTLAYCAHLVPFLAWVLMMQFLDLPGFPPAWRYAFQTAVGIVLLLALRPWRWYAPLRIRHLPLAFGVGVLVFVAWVGMETAWVGRTTPGLQDLYLRWAVLPLGKVPESLTRFPYAPEVCGWPLALVRLAGSAFVIAVSEEFFWRGFLYRWMVGKNFLRVDVSRFDPVMFPAVAILFGIEHAQWLAGIVAGLAYGWVYGRTRDIWAAAAAHVVTNFLLGLYVLATGRYHFW